MRLSKTYSVKEVYYTLQGEGFHAGRAAVFCRFAGCNLWTGLEKDRSSAVCQFCDTDFWGTDGVNGGKYTCHELVAVINNLWPGDSPGFVVFTGGEPALQLDEDIIEKMHEKGFELAIETNGTLNLPTGIDWVCVSPKAKANLLITRGDELKLVFPQDGLTPDMFKEMDFKYFYLQPMDNSMRDENTKDAIRYCHSNPRWRLSLQTHKYLGIP